MQLLNNLQIDLVHELRKLPASSVYIGFSGGVDSTLLLALACQAFGHESVSAIHVHHGLSAQADAWHLHCKRITEQLGCHFIARHVTVEPHGQGIEAEARIQRYQVFHDVLPDNALLLLGQHLDDQVETFFLRLLRGAGPHGLQSMPVESQRDHYRIHRPLLGTAREQIVQLAEKLKLTWVDDESNLDPKFDRNFLRLSVLPLIEQRWPSYRDRVIQTIELLQAPSESIAAFNVDNELEHRLSHDKGLKLVQLDSFSEAQILTLLHRWLTLLGQQIPSRQRLKAVLDNVINAGSDTQPLVEIGQGSIRRHGLALYWVPDIPSVSSAPELVKDQWCRWQGVGQVMLETVVDETLCLKKGLPDLHWQVRQGGESMWPVGRSKRRDLKRLLQEYRIKPWLRDRIPLLFSGDELVAVGEELVSVEHLAEKGEAGLRVKWINPENLV